MAITILKGDAEAPLDPLIDAEAPCRVAVIGYGNQGRAHANNLRDSGVDVVISGRPDGSGMQAASKERFETASYAEALKCADLAIIATPDEAQPALWRDQLAPHVREGQTIGFLHGFAVHYGFIEPPANIGVVMVAPKGPGTTLRSVYESGRGIPCLLAVHQESPNNDAEKLALAWANGIGCARAGIIRTTFKNETETDLFGEQTVLCGGVTELILAAFETLTDAGYPPELAYLECCHELKQIGDLIYARGIAGMTDAISNTAEFGAYEAGPRLIDDAVRSRMREVLNEIQNGAFAERFIDDAESGDAWHRAKKSLIEQHPITSPGATIRGLMPWLDSSK